MDSPHPSRRWNLRLLAASMALVIASVVAGALVRPRDGAARPARAAPLDQAADASDFGDAPDSFRTLGPNGAHHRIGNTQTTLVLGTSVDPEPDGQPGPGADGDDLAASDDEDGAVSLPPLIACQTTVLVFRVTNLLQNPAYLNAWIDFNGNQRWDDLGEHVIVDRSVWGGNAFVPITTPCDAVGNPAAHMRLRLASEAGLTYWNPTDYTPDGEVEDHTIEIMGGLADLAVTLADLPDPVRPGAPLRYTATVSNGGPAVAESVELVTTIPAHTAFVSAVPAQGTCAFDAPSREVRCDLHDIAKDGRVDTQIDVVVDADAGVVIQGPATLHSAASVAADRPDDPVTANNTDTEPTNLDLEGLLDFGDAPAPYPSVHHRITANPGGPNMSDLMLGTTVDAETSLTGNASATTDDLTGIDDEEIPMGPPSTALHELYVCKTDRIGFTVYLSDARGAPAMGYVNAWLDFNRDQDWDDAGERLVDNRLETGNGGRAINVDVAVPCDAAPGATFLRLRVSREPLAGPGASEPAPDGEVEDHVLELKVPEVDLAVQIGFQTATAPVVGLLYPDTVVIGEPFSYDLLASNNGQEDAHDVVLTHALPPRVSFVDATTQTQGVACQAAGGVLTCQKAEMASLTSFMVRVTLRPEIGVGCRITTTADITSREPDANPADNHDAEDAAVRLPENALDWGDAPDGYGTTAAAGGPRHWIDETLRLGALIDPEADGAPGDTAFGDDAAGADDEDGVEWPTDLEPGQPATVVVTTSGPGKLSVWIDFGRDGDFGGDAVFIDRDVAGGANALDFTVPPAADTGLTIARFRLVAADESAPAPTDAGCETIARGEVEDHAVWVGPDPGTTDLGITKTDAPDPAMVGERLDYTIAVTNYGYGTARSVTMTDVIPPEMTYDPARAAATTSRGACVYDGAARRLSCDLGDLALGEVATITVPVDVTYTFQPGETIHTVTNTAHTAQSLPAGRSDPEPQPHSATATTKIIQACNYDIMLAIDTSGSMEGVRIQRAVEAAKAAIDMWGVDPGNPQYQVGLVPFNSVVHHFVHLTRDAGTLKGVLDGLVGGAGGGTNITAGIAAAHDELKLPGDGHRREGARPVIIILTDGEHTEGAPEPEAAIAAAKADGIWIMTVALGVNPETAERMARWATGGHSIVIDDETDLLRAFRTIAEWTCGRPSRIPTDLEVAKTGPEAACPLDPDDVVYTVTVVNHTRAWAINPKMTDTLPKGVTYVGATAEPEGWDCAFAADASGATGGTVTCTADELDPEATATITITVGVDACAGPTLHNTATVTADNQDPNPANNTAAWDTAIGAVDLEVTKVGDPLEAVAGAGVITYTVTVASVGACPAHGVVLADVVPAGLNITAVADTLDVCTVEGQIVNCDLGTLTEEAEPSDGEPDTPPVREPVTVTIKAAVPCDLPAGVYTNTVTATPLSCEGSPVSAQADTEVVHRADLKIEKSHAPDPAQAGQPLTFFLDVTNLGPSSASQVVVTDPLPDDVSFVAVNPGGPTCTHSGESKGGTVTCDLGAMECGATARIEIEVAIEDECAAEIANEAEVANLADGEVDPDPDNNLASTTAEVEGGVCSDTGDAPDSFNHSGVPMTAYPTGAPANFPTVYESNNRVARGPLHRSAKQDAWLGESVTGERDADLDPDQDPSNNIEPASNQADLDGADDSVLPQAVQFPTCGPALFTYAITVAPTAPVRTRFVNVWIDFNRDGDWADVLTCTINGVTRTVPEWAVRDNPSNLGPGTHHRSTPQFSALQLPGPAAAKWMRISLSDATAPLPQDGRGPYAGYQFGETEDYLVTGSQSGQPFALRADRSPRPIPD